MCVDYMCLYQVLLPLSHKGFENTTLNDISVIDIPEVLINILYCRGFFKEENLTVILTCYIKLVYINYQKHL